MGTALAQGHGIPAIEMDLPIAAFERGEVVGALTRREPKAGGAAPATVPALPDDYPHVPRWGCGPRRGDLEVLGGSLASAIADGGTKVAMVKMTEDLLALLFTHLTWKATDDLHLPGREPSAVTKLPKRGCRKRRPWCI